jgi:hypothetical protein
MVCYRGGEQAELLAVLCAGHQLPLRLLAREGEGEGSAPCGWNREAWGYLTWSVTGRARRRNFLQSCELGTSSPSGTWPIKSFPLPCFTLQLKQSCRSKYITRIVRTTYTDPPTRTGSVKYLFHLGTGILGKRAL